MDSIPETLLFFPDEETYNNISRVTSPNADQSQEAPATENLKSANQSDVHVADEQCPEADDQTGPSMDEAGDVGVNKRGSRGSTASMDQGQLTEQLALVQEIVQEMKHSFTIAMEELAKTQYGDESLQHQISIDKEKTQQQISDLTGTVVTLQAEIQQMKTQFQEILASQKVLEDRLKNQESLKTEPRMDNHPKDPSPMVHPYLATLHQQKDDCDTQSVTALACKSLNLSQALHEKCLHLEASASSDEDDPIRTLQSQGLSVHQDGNYFIDEKHHFSQKKPLHERVSDEVQREKAVQEIIEAERSYCSQLWTLIDGYMNPLSQSELMDSRDLYAIFPSYITQMYEQHCMQLHKMEERLLKWKFSSLIGDVFLKMTDSQEGDGLSLYKEYINDFSAVINNINRWFSLSARFRTLIGSSSLATSNLIPLLLAPLQQIPKYSLLLKNLMKHTSLDHPDRTYLESALYHLKNFLYMMNSDIESAMQFLNVNRSRDCGNSMRSRSSGSSCEANQVSSARDSGIHEEDNPSHQQPSPNATRRYVLQVFRERRERESQGYRDRPVSVPPRPQHTFGSHPDLTQQEYADLVTGGRSDVYLPYQSGQKMYSSLTKIHPQNPGMRSPEKPPRKIKIRRRPDSQKGNISSNYLRPLTPHFPFSSTPAHTARPVYDDTRGTTGNRRLPFRPASSIDFTGREAERRDKLLDNWSFHHTDLNSPRGHPGEGRARNELHLSLQRLMAERELEPYSAGHSSRNLDRDPVPGTFDENERKFEELINDSESNHEDPVPQIFRKKIVEDYGIYGDNDDEENFDDSSAIQVDDGAKNDLVSQIDERLETSAVYQNSSVTMQSGKSRGGHSEKNNSQEVLSGSESYEENSSQNLVLKDLSVDMAPEHLVPVKQNSEKSQKVSERRKNNSDSESKKTEQTSVKLAQEKTPVLQAEKPSEKHVPKVMQRKSGSVKQIHTSDVNKNELKIDLSENGETGKGSVQPVMSRANSGSKSDVNKTVSPTNSFQTIPSHLSTVTTRSPKKLPILSGRLSHPNMEYRQSAPVSKLSSSPPVSPTESKSLRNLAKDTKIPLYNPRMKEKNGKAQNPLSKSSEDVSKIKKKSAFGSIKSFFGKKRKMFRRQFTDFSSSFDLTNCDQVMTKEFSSELDLRDRNSVTEDRMNFSEFIFDESWIEDSEFDKIPSESES